MRNLDRDRIQISKNMGAVRLKVKLINAMDEELVERGLLNPNLLRACEADMGAVRVKVKRHCNNILEKWYEE